MAPGAYRRFTGVYSETIHACRVNMQEWARAGMSPASLTERVVMGLTFRKALKLGRRTRANLSRTGASASRRVGPVTVSSRGRITLRLGKGWGWRL